MMFRTALVSGLLSAALLAGPTLAQATGETPAPTEAPVEAPAATPTAPQQGQPVVVATHRDWEIVCSPEVEGQIQQCEMYQLLRDNTDSPIAEITIAALPLGAEFSAGATVTTPLETFLPSGMGFRIGEAEEMRVEGFRVCTVIGCVVRMGLTPDEVDRMKAGTTATIMIAPFIAIDQPVEITVSLAGFTAALEDLQTRLSEAAAAARTNP